MVLSIRLLAQGVQVLQRFRAGLAVLVALGHLESSLCVRRVQLALGHLLGRLALASLCVRRVQLALGHLLGRLALDGL